MAIACSSISYVGRLPYRVYLRHNCIYSFPHFMRAPLVLRGKPGNEANLYALLYRSHEINSYTIEFNTSYNME